MTFWEIVLLGIVQGISEFLPISSDGHLVVVEACLGHKTENLALNVALHVGTLLSILTVYRRDVIPVLRQPKLVFVIAVATVPVVIAALLFGDQFEAAQNSSLAAGWGLLVTSGLLFLTPRFDQGTRSMLEVSWKDALVIGLFQAAAPLPGVSRSGTTIVSALLMGLERRTATDFSFYIAVPAILGATIKELILDRPKLDIPPVNLAAGMVISFAVGVVALRSLIRIVAARKLIWFAWYVLVVGIVTLAASLWGWIEQRSS